MIKKISFLFIIFFLNVTLVLSSQELSSPFMADSLSLEVHSLEYKTSKELSRTSIDVKKDPSLAQNIFTVTKNGQGRIDKYENASWTITAHLRNQHGFLETLDSVCHIKNKKGHTLAIYKKLYDYKKNIITWESYDKNETLKNKKDFPLKGKTCDDTTLIFFLKAFMPNINQEEQFFYLLTNEPKLFKTKITFIGKEKLNLPGGEIEASKIKLTADIGILDDVLDRFVPKTYLWYSTTPPYHWLQYQGFEKDAKSAYVLNILNKKHPH